MLESAFIRTLLVMGVMIEGETGVEDISKCGIGELRISRSSTLTLYPPVPHFRIFVPNFTIHHDNSLKFQPLFKTPLLHTEPCQLSIGHPSCVPQDLGTRSLRGEYCYVP